MKTCAIGDLVTTSKYARTSLDMPPIGYGYVTKVVGRDIVYVTWYNNGTTRPINIRWLNIIK